MAILDNVTRGGQTWAHRIRMFKQVFKIALIGSLISFFFTLGMFLYLKVPHYKYRAFYYYAKAATVGVAREKIEVDSDYYYSEKSYHKKTLSVQKDALEAHAKKDILSLLETIKVHVIPSGITGVGTFILFIIFFYVKGLSSRKKKHISGSIVKARKVSAINWKGEIRIGKALLCKEDETQHILVSGGTGSGKTNAFHHIIPQIRKRDQKAVVVDTTGVFISKYYDPNKDIILNPLDVRSKKWLPWAECASEIDYKALSKSFIPSEPHDSDAYWNEAAATVFASLLKSQEEVQDIKGFIHLLLNSSMASLSKALVGTKGAAHIDPSSDKAAASVRSVASTHLECLEYLDCTSEPFSVRKWVQDEKDKGFLFLSCTTDQRSALKPLLSAWYALAIRGLMALPINLNRRLWLINDELPAMSRIMGLEVCLTEGRKYGAAALLAIQSPAQLEEIYGRHRTKTIMANCATKLVFREQDPISARLLSQVFGDKEVIETQEGFSYGAHEMRDGVNHSNMLKNRPVISASDIQNLKKNEGFLKCPSGDMIEKVRLKFM